MLFDIIGYIVVATVFLIVSYYIYDCYFGDSTLKCIVSDINGGDVYCIRERSKAKETEAVNLLARVVEKGKKFVKFLNEKYPDEEFAQRLVNNFNPETIKETLPTSSLTAFTENKGTSMSLCLNRQKEDDNQLIDENLLTFVFLHEMSHIAYSDFGHTADYWLLFKRILKEAEMCGIYRPEDYKKENQEYCGIQITNNPYYQITE